MGKFIAAVLALVLLVVGFIDLVEPNGWGFFGKVANGNVAVVTRFGKAQDEVLEPGMHVKSYFSVLNPMSTQTQKVQIPLAAFSSDIQQVNAVVTLNYNVDKTNAVTLFREVGKGYVGSLMSPRIQENTKIVFSHYTAENLVQKRDTLSAEILTLMQEDLIEFGVNASGVAIEDIDFSDAFTNAVEAKQVATQEALSAKIEQQKLTEQAEAEAKRKKLEAEAKAEIAKLEADAKAYSVQVEADAEAEANSKIAASLTEELIEYRYTEAWNGELPGTFIGNSDALPIINIDGEDKVDNG